MPLAPAAAVRVARVRLGECVVCWVTALGLLVGCVVQEGAKDVGGTELVLLD